MSWAAPSVAATESIIRVNVAGSNYTDSAGRLWSADSGYNTGMTAWFDTSFINTNDSALYMTQRWDEGTSPELKYAFDVANGDYLVKLHFAEGHSGAFGVGRRVFDVLLEGQTALSNFDIYARAGARAAYVASLPVTVTDGRLDIDFRHRVENPTVAAIEVLRVTPDAAATAPTSESGTILREVWTNLPGLYTSGLTNNSRYPDSPNSTSQLTSFELPRDNGDNHGSRVRGYVLPPTTGNYTFWIAADDTAELWLSTDASPANKRRIAYVPSWVNNREFTRYSQQRSTSIRLEAGKRYYVEAIHKENTGGDHMAVAWQTTGISRMVIPGHRLAPWVNSTTPAPAPEPAEPTPTPAPSGTGLQATYYYNQDFTQAVATRVDAAVNFDWGVGVPISGMSPNGFSVRWVGEIMPVHSSGTQTYTFYTLSDDGIRVWVNGQLIIDGWRDQAATEYSGRISLAAGQRYRVQVDYYDRGGDKVARLSWATNGVARQVVPGSRLYPVTSSGGDSGGSTPPSTGGGGTVTSGAAALSWSVPVSRADGSPLPMSEIAGYRIRYGTASRQYSDVVDVSDAYATSRTISQLTAGRTYYFVITARDTAGNESAPSNEVSKTIN